MKHVYTALLAVVIVLQIASMTRSTGHTHTHTSIPDDEALCEQFCALHGGERQHASIEAGAYCYCINDINEVEFDIKAVKLRKQYSDMCRGVSNG